MKRWYAIVPLAVLAVLAVMFWAKSLNREVQFQPDALVGQTTPAVALEPLMGGPARPLNEVAKGPALINVFGSWCVACVVEHPLLMDLERRGVPVIGVAWRDQPEKTLAFLRQRGDPYSAVLMDPNGQAAIGLGITAAPESFLVDRTGKIIYKQTGPLTPEAVELIVNKAKGA